jgi:eukaryotic-like serine/threonine-protein kinase
MDLPQRGWAFVIAAAVLAGLSAVLAKQWLPGAVAGGVAAAAAVVGGVWVAHGSLLLQARDARRGVLSAEVWTSGSRRLPRVRELNDPIALGVHPAAGSRESQFDRVPPFIRREVDGELLVALRQVRFVLLVGESTAGKSRLAYELVRAELPDHRIVIPERRESALAAAELAAAEPRCVLWLDDLERFLGSGGLTKAAVRQILEAHGTERFIVATIRSEEYAGFGGRASNGMATAGRDVMRQGWDVLRLAVCIQVPRRWSSADVAQARQRSDDPRLAEAVGHAAEYGVAEYLAAGPQLLAEWRDAWAPAAHPRAAAMVLAAVDARRAGIHRPLPLRVLLEMHEPYLQEHGGDRLRPETPESALAWATDPLFATSSLLMPVDGEYLAFDYLIDAVGRERVPEKALEPLIAFATPNEAIDVGRLARGWSWTRQADLAFRRAEAGGLFDGTSHRCWLLRQEQGLPAALQFALDTVSWTTAAYGPEGLGRPCRARAGS